MMPPPREARDPSAWWDAYVRTYLERDLRDLAQVHSLPDFRRLASLVALRSGQVIDQAEIARTLGNSQATVHRHLGLLATVGWGAEPSTLLRTDPASLSKDGPLN
jgi:predicted AAA+ superfamily ATPase